MKRLGWPGLILLVVLLPLTLARGTGWRKVDNALELINDRIHGKIVDYTANHGEDRRIWSMSLGQRRDMYVYLPPCYNPKQCYPIMIWLHGFAQDEQYFAHHIAPMIDLAIHKGKLPPMIVAAPDGSHHGEPCFLHPGSFFIDSRVGDFEEFIVHDVWDFLARHYPLRPEREAHVLAGVSMGGFGAYNLGIRHRDQFGVVVGVYPPLNLRWMDDCGNYQAKFDPYHWGWRTSMDRPREVVARFMGGLVNYRIGQLLEPLFGDGEECMAEVSRANPIELVDRTHLQNGQLEMYVAYTGRDEFNIDAQVESFLYLCRFRGLSVGVGYEADGKHDLASAQKLFPGIVRWLTQRLERFAPPGCEAACLDAACENDAHP